MEVEQILSRLWGPGIDSCTRLDFMLDEVGALPSELFWPVFHEVWPTCDSTWAQQDSLLDLLRFHQPSHPRLNGSDRTFYEGLPESFSAYRGCSRSRLFGLSWSTDRDVAETFANGHRGIPVPDPIVVHARFSKSAVLAVSTIRGESEILIDPDEIQVEISLSTPIACQ